MKTQPPPLVIGVLIKSSESRANLSMAYDSRCDRSVTANDACPMCKSQAAGSRLIVFQDERWLVRHSSETNILGYLVLESRRHFLDLSHACKREADTFGPLLSATLKAIRLTVPCERIYTFTLCEMVPHFHVHLIPRTSRVPRPYRGRGILSYPLQPTCDEALLSEVVLRLRRHIALVAARRN